MCVSVGSNEALKGKEDIFFVLLTFIHMEYYER